MASRDLDVVSEDPVVADLEVRYARYLPFLGFYPGNPFLAAAADRSELIEFLAVALANNPTVLETRGRGHPPEPSRWHGPRRRDRPSFRML